MADETAGRRVPFAFLEDIHQRFVRTYGRAVHSAQAYGMNEEFSRVLSQQMEYYSNDLNADRMNRLKGEMNQVRFQMLFIKLAALVFISLKVSDCCVLLPLLLHPPCILSVCYLGRLILQWKFSLRLNHRLSYQTSPYVKIELLLVKANLSDSSVNLDEMLAVSYNTIAFIFTARDYIRNELEVDSPFPTFMLLVIQICGNICNWCEMS